MYRSQGGLLQIVDTIFFSVWRGMLPNNPKTNYCNSIVKVGNDELLLLSSANCAVLG